MVPAQSAEIASELREIARSVRGIGYGRSDSPEAILVAKYNAADRLFALARRMEGGSHD